MLLGLERVISLGAVPAMLDIAVLVGAVRHVVERQVGDLREFLIEFVAKFFLLGLQRRQRDFKLVHLGHQLLRRGLVLFLLGLADFLRRGITPRLRLLELGDRRAALLVERQQLAR